MEFIVVLWLLYGVQCVSWLPARSESFIGWLGGWIATQGPGLRGLHPRPSGRAFRASRFPLRECDGDGECELRVATEVTWWAAQRASVSERGVDLAQLGEASAAGENVRVAGAPIARLASPAEAMRLAEALRALAAAPAEARPAQLRSLLQQRFSAANFAAADAQACTATRWLARVADGYAIAALAMLPVAIAIVGAEPTLYAVWPVFVALHVVTLWLLMRAHRRLFADETGARWEMFAAAAFYPPLCWRAPHDLATRARGSFHPATVAASVLPQAERDRVLRREFLAARELAAEAIAAPFGLAACELDLLRELADGVGASEAALFAPPERVDPRSLAFCPACRSEYRRASGECSGCQVRLEAFEA